MTHSKELNNSRSNWPGCDCSTWSGVLTLTPIGIVTIVDGCILELEAVQPVERGPRHWRQIGQSLACIHQNKSDHFGLATNGTLALYIKIIPPLNYWPTFYAERRLLPGMRLAIDSGNLPQALIKPLEMLIERLPGLCGPVVVPIRGHGNAQQNNFIGTEMGLVVIDPAVYFGHPEMDLAFIDYFQAVPQVVFYSIQEELPIDPGFWERRYLWRIWGYLGCLTVAGSGYLGRLTEAIQRYG